MTREETISHIQLAKEMGLASVMIEGIRYEFKNEAVAPTPHELTKAELSMLDTFNDLTDDEILYYSTPYYDELTAQKELRAQQLKEKAENG